MNLAMPTGPDPLRKLSEELHALAEEFRERKVTLREVMSTLGGRASGLVIVILALPFCSPISIPGLSVPFGAVILVLGLCYVAGRPPWLPRRLLAVELPPRFFRAVLEGASKFIGWIERRLHPRWAWVTGSTAIMRAHGLLVCAGAFLLLLPLGGIPFTNTLPALVVVIGTLGMMERDGVAVAAAYGILIATGVYFATFAGVVIELFDKARQWIAG
ncbi:MAG: exopolysaccharide biosynthesis protein [Verrucomicrobia bacterium]|nr:exopolysaccharide biosynthesis protein [Verrucomicrobiota bacterium]